MNKSDFSAVNLSLRKADNFDTRSIAEFKLAVGSRRNGIGQLNRCVIDIAGREQAGQCDEPAFVNRASVVTQRRSIVYRVDRNFRRVDSNAESVASACVASQGNRAAFNTHGLIPGLIRKSGLTVEVRVWHESHKSICAQQQGSVW